jgi:quaternary ammonium compound-resistance protein SugE
MPWLALVVAGLLEVAWALALPETKGFTRLLPSALFLALLSGSMLGLAYATRTLPIGTAYAVWVGIGAVGTVLGGIAVRGDHASGPQLVALGALVASIVAVKLTATTH